MMPFARMFQRTKRVWDDKCKLGGQSSIYYSGTKRWIFIWGEEGTGEVLVHVTI